MAPWNAATVVPLHDQEAAARATWKARGCRSLDAKFELASIQDCRASTDHQQQLPQGSCNRRDRAESFVAISIDTLSRTPRHVNGRGWILGGRVVSLFGPASLFLDKDGIEPDAVWEIENVGYRRTIHSLRSASPCQDRRATRCSTALDLSECGPRSRTQAIQFGGARRHARGRTRDTRGPARRSLTRRCGPSSPDLLSGLLFQSIDPRTGRPVEPAGSPIEREEPRCAGACS